MLRNHLLASKLLSSDIYESFLGSSIARITFIGFHLWLLVCFRDRPNWRITIFNRIQMRKKRSLQNVLWTSAYWDQWILVFKCRYWAGPKLYISFCSVRVYKVSYANLQSKCLRNDFWCSTCWNKNFYLFEETVFGLTELCILNVSVCSEVQNYLRYKCTRNTFQEYLFFRHPLSNVYDFQNMVFGPVQMCIPKVPRSFMVWKSSALMTLY